MTLFSRRVSCEQFCQVWQLCSPRNHQYKAARNKVQLLWQRKEAKRGLVYLKVTKFSKWPEKSFVEQMMIGSWYSRHLIVRTVVTFIPIWHSQKKFSRKNNVAQGSNGISSAFNYIPRGSIYPDVTASHAAGVAVDRWLFSWNSASESARSVCSSWLRDDKHNEQEPRIDCTHDTTSSWQRSKDSIHFEIYVQLYS